MTDLPKIVARRLRNSRTVEVHPDPNLIAAFLESSLQKQERAQLLDHLAQCGTCREIAELSAPEGIEVVSPRKGSPSAWLSWPVLRWGTAAACVIVVGAAVGLHYRTHPVRDAETAVLQSDVSKVRAQAPAPALTLADNGAAKKLVLPHSPASGPAENKNKRDSVSRVATKQLDQTAEPSRSIVSAPVAGSSVAGNLVARSDQLSERRETELAKSETTFAKTAPADQVSATTETDAKLGNENIQVVPSRSKDEIQESLQYKAKAGLGTGLAAKSAMASPPLPRRAPLPLAAGFLPRWTLNENGHLQRSLDSGRTWEAIPFPTRTNFHALVAHGLEVWVGGMQGILYHSADAGQRWKLVHPTDHDQALTADIIRLDFPDTLHGTLTTADQQTWVTEDGGQTWAKR